MQKTLVATFSPLSKRQIHTAERFAGTQKDLSSKIQCLNLLIQRCMVGIARADL